MAQTAAAGGGREKEESTISGDVLEEVISHTPLVDLVPAVHVSKAWNKAVYSSLRGINPPKPWLFLHRQRLRSPYTAAISAYAYDPRSDVWMMMMDVSQPSVPLLKSKSTSILRSSNSNFLFTLSPSKFSFSFDPLNLTWHHAEGPLVWRQDPIVAKVGDSVIVAGGAWDFESDPLAVEIYDIGKRKWRRRRLSRQPSCESNSISMPSSLKEATSSVWLSIAASSEKLYVMQKYSGVVHVFDAETCRWSNRPHTVRPHPRCFYSVIGFINRRRSLILVGLIGDDIENVGKVKVWEVGCDDEDFTCNEIGEMPQELAEKIVMIVNNENELSLGCGIEICTAGNFVYVYNPAYLEEVVVCELEVNGGGIGCRWGSVRNFAGDDICGLDWVVFTCSEVNVEDLERAMTMNGRRYKVIHF